MYSIILKCYFKINWALRGDGEWWDCVFAARGSRELASVRPHPVQTPSRSQSNQKFGIAYEFSHFLTIGFAWFSFWGVKFDDFQLFFHNKYVSPCIWCIHYYHSFSIITLSLFFFKLFFQFFLIVFSQSFIQFFISFVIIFLDFFVVFSQSSSIASFCYFFQIEFNL